MVETVVTYTQGALTCVYNATDYSLSCHQGPRPPPSWSQQITSAITSFAEQFTTKRALQIGEGVAVSVVFLAVYLLLVKPRTPAFLKRKFVMPVPVKILALPLVVVGAAIYFWTVLITVGYSIPLNHYTVANNPLWGWVNRDWASGMITSYFSFQSFQNCPANVVYDAQYNQYYTLLGCSSLGCIGFLFAGVATAGVTMMELGKGFVAAVRNAFTYFALPAVLVLQVGLQLYDSKDMATHVSNFTVLAINGVQVVSNNFVLSLVVCLIFGSCVVLPLIDVSQIGGEGGLRA